MNRQALKNKSLIAKWWNSANKRLLKRAKKLTGNPDAAEDIVQHVALAVLTYRKPFVSEEHFLRWTLQKLKWLSLDYFRKKSREQTVFDAKADMDSLLIEPKQEWDQIISEIFTEIQKLPDRQREVAERYYFKHDEIKIIAADLKIKQSTVRSFLRHARSQLAERLANDEVEKDYVK